MKHLTIFQRLVLSYIAIFVVVVAFGVYMTVKLSQLNKITSSISSSDIKIIRLSNLLRDSFISQTGFSRKYIISGDHDFYDQFFKAEESIQKSLSKLKMFLLSNEKVELISKIETTHNRFLDIIKKEFDKSSSSASPDIKKNQTENEYYLNRIVGSIEKIKPLKEAKNIFEKDYIFKMLSLTGGNVSQASKLAGKYRADFYLLLKKHNLKAQDFKMLK